MGGPGHADPDLAQGLDVGGKGLAHEHRGLLARPTPRMDALGIGTAWAPGVILALLEENHVAPHRSDVRACVPNGAIPRLPSAT